jgi:DNA-binding NarL/FixJ family response regulator
MASHDTADVPVDAPAAPRLRVIVADDDPLVRRVVKETLQRDGLTVIAEASTGVEAIQLALHYRPQVLLMDVVMPEMDGITAVRRLARDAPDLVVVMLTNADESELAMVALRAGAVGVLRKDIDLASLPQAIRGANDGEAVISRRFGRRLLESLREAPEPAAGMRPVKGPLTSREWEVVGLLEAGHSTDEIAEALVLARETVRSHVKNILRKLDVRSREQAVARAQEMRRGPAA